MKKEKELYTSPEVNAFILQSEGVVCQSPNGYNQGSAGDYSGSIFDNGSY